MKVLIVAGGKGTRMGTVSTEIPKALLPVNGRPVLEYQVELLKNEGFTDFVFSIGHLGSQVRKHFGDGSRLGVKIVYSEESEPLGTGGAVKLAEPFFKGEKDFLCVFADLMMKLDCRKMLDFHAKKQALATFLAHESDHPWDSDLIVADEAGRVREMPGKLGKGAPLPTNLTKSSVYAFNSKIFKHMPAGKFDLDKDVLKKIVAEGGKNVYAYHSEEFVKDMGTPERYEKMQRQWPSIWNNGRIGRKAVFLDRDGTIIEEANLLTKYEQVKYIPGVFEAVKKLNDAGFAVVIVSNQPVVARNLATEKQVLEVQERINKDFGERGAELDAFYYCPHHPEKHHADGNPAYRMECECRKPKPGMLLKAAERLGIDLESSWMVGDQNRDVAAGKRVGCKAILVGTGYAGKQAGTDKKEGFEPDFSAKDLPAAVELILKRTSK